MTRGRVLRTGVLWVLLVATSPAAPAQTDDPPEALLSRVARLVEEADAARAEGRYEAAVAKLREALSLHRDPGLVYNLARTYEDARQPAQAADHYELCLRSGPDDEVRRLAEEGLRRTGAPQAPEPTPATAEQEPTGEAPVARPPRARWIHLSLSLAEGLYIDGTDVRRTNVGLELLPALRWDWVQLDLGLAVLVEEPVAFLGRPGVRFHVGPAFFRIAGQLLASSAVVTGGVLAGAGGQIAVGGGWYAFGEFDASLWPSAISQVPMEFRLGVGYGF